ncbi:MAG: elongation factor P, partial [Omnitrophica WOR_2 bacterium]
YLYNDGSLYHFMDLDNYEQYAIPKETIGELEGYLTENLEVKLTFYEGEPLDIELPTSVDMKITQADVAVRGDTATGVTKRVTTETGLTVQVPNFVGTGDTIKVDTRTGSYITRV